jgi:hypothetical protein
MPKAETAMWGCWPKALATFHSVVAHMPFRVRPKENMLFS